MNFGFCEGYELLFVQIVLETQSDEPYCYESCMDQILKGTPTSRESHRSAEVSSSNEK